MASESKKPVRWVLLGLAVRQRSPGLVVPPLIRSQPGDQKKADVGKSSYVKSPRFFLGRRASRP